MLFFFIIFFMSSFIIFFFFVDSVCVKYIIQVLVFKCMFFIIILIGIISSVQVVFCIDRLEIFLREREGRIYFYVKEFILFEYVLQDYKVSLCIFFCLKMNV